MKVVQMKSQALTKVADLLDEFEAPLVGVGLAGMAIGCLAAGVTIGRRTFVTSQMLDNNGVVIFNRISDLPENWKEMIEEGRKFLLIFENKDL